MILKALRGEPLDNNEEEEAVLQPIKKGFIIEPRLLARILKGKLRCESLRCIQLLMRYCQA